MDTSTETSPRASAVGNTLAQRLQWALEVAEGMKALHQIGVAHRDLKSDNCLLCTVHHHLLSLYTQAEIAG